MKVLVVRQYEEQVEIEVPDGSDLDTIFELANNVLFDSNLLERTDITAFNLETDEELGSWG